MNEAMQAVKRADIQAFLALAAESQQQPVLFSPSAPLAELVLRLGGGRSLAERVKLARWKRKRPAAQPEVLS